MTEYLNGLDVAQESAFQRATKSVSSLALNATNLFAFTGTIHIVAITGRITTIIQDQATSIKLQILADALAAYDICTAKEVRTFPAGTLISITGTAANAAASTTAVGALAPGQANPVVATCVTSGYIAQHSTAASTGAITWEILWQPVSAGATVTPA